MERERETDRQTEIDRQTETETYYRDIPQTETETNGDRDQYRLRRKPYNYKPAHGLFRDAIYYLQSICD